MSESAGIFEIKHPDVHPDITEDVRTRIYEIGKRPVYREIALAFAGKWKHQVTFIGMGYLGQVTETRAAKQYGQVVGLTIASYNFLQESSWRIKK